MNTVWSEHIQGIQTLYLSRSLRFDDMFFSRYEKAFDLDREAEIKVLEIGCWDEETEEWYFSIVDVIGVLTEQRTFDGARDYWKVLKKRLKNEALSWLQIVTN